MKYRYQHSAKHLIAICCLIITVMSSCKKMVDINQPISTLTVKETFMTDKQAAGTLAGLYSQMYTNSGQKEFSNGYATIYGGMSGDELVSQAGVANPIDYPFQTNSLLKDNIIPESMFWDPAYKNIYNANTIIEGVAASTSSQLTDSARRELTAESKFVRAFNYFYLTNYFGDVALALTSDFTVTSKLPRAPQTAVYTQIIKDLKDAQAALPVNYIAASAERIRPNRAAATALLARVYLYQKDWANAEAQATAVISNSLYSLVPSLSGVFIKNSQEAIWQLQPNVTTTPFGATYEGVSFIPSADLTVLPPALLSAYLVPSVFDTYVVKFIPTYYMSPQLANAFETNDQRKKLWASYVPVPSYAPYNGQSIFYPFKYIIGGTNPSTSNNQYYMVLRLAEQYLIRAEARAQQNNLSGAASDLSGIRSRAGLAPVAITSQADMLNSIAHERQVELFCEWGHRFFDLKRTGKAADVLGAIASKQPFSPSQLLYPIPPSEIRNDPYLTQNPGY